MTRLTDSDILAANTITTRSSDAIVAANICLDTIAVITGFALVHTTVTADLSAALRIATIACAQVTIITSFALIDAVVTAALKLAHAIAAITRIGVAVIAGFHTRSHRAITAARHGAGIQAHIGVHSIAVVASLITLIALSEPTA